MLRLAASRGGGPRNALGHRPEPEVLPLPAETSREAQKVLRRPEPEVLPLPAETSREAPECCAWRHSGGGPRNALGHRPEPEVLPLPAETSREAEVLRLKCCPCQQKRAARLESAAPGSIEGGGPRNALGHRPEPEVLPLPAETSREAQKCCTWQGPRNALGHRPEPEVLPLPAETSREAQKCCAWQHQEGGARNALGHRPEPEVLPLPPETSRAGGGGGPKRAARLKSAAPGSIEGGPSAFRGPVQSLKCCPCQQKRAAASRGGARNALGHCPEPEVLPLPARLRSAAPGSIEGGGAPKRARAPSRA